MKRSELEHVIRASGAIADDRELIIIGSQSILGQFPDAPVTLLASMETDLYPRNRPERADLTRELASNRMTDRATLLARLAKTRVAGTVRTMVKNRIDADFAPRGGRRHAKTR